MQPRESPAACQSKVDLPVACDRRECTEEIAAAVLPALIAASMLASTPTLHATRRDRTLTITRYPLLSSMRLAKRLAKAAEMPRSGRAGFARDLQVHGLSEHKAPGCDHVEQAAGAPDCTSFPTSQTGQAASGVSVT